MTRCGYHILLIMLVITLTEPGLLRPAVHAAPLFQAPTNDNFANALLITAFPYSNTQDTALATTEANDPVYPCTDRQHYHSVWYAYMATASGTLHVDTIGSDYDTVLAVWTGTWGSLTNVGCHDDISWPGNPQSTLDVSVVSGTTYYVEVVGYYASSSGTLLLSADLRAVPPNDDFDNAFVISATPYTYNQDTSLATTAADDPVFQACGTGGGSVHSHSVWYRFTPSTNGTLHVDTGGSDYDTVLAVWTGSRGSLTQVACHDDVNWPSDPTSFVDLEVVAGTTYYIEVVSYRNTAGGSLTLNAGFSLPPANKPLYLHNLAAPVTIVDGTVTTEIMDRRQVWGGEATLTFDNSPTYYSYLYPGLTGDLVLRGTVNAYLYFEADDAQNSRVTVDLTDLAPGGTSTTIGSVTVEVPRGSDDWYVFSIANVNYTVAQGHALVLGMRTAAAAQDVTLHYDSATHNSRVELAVATYVHVEGVSTSSACQPAGSTVFSAGQTMTVTALVSDPFGSYDIAGAEVAISGPGGSSVLPPTAMTVATTTPGDIAYEFGYAIPPAATPGTYLATVTGTESNGIQATGTTTFTVQTPAALSASLAATPLTVDVGQTVNVSMTVTNLGQATVQGVSPSALVLSGTGTATFSSGPIPASSDILGGGTATFTWTYQATAGGVVRWSGSAGGTDANSCATVSAPEATSNDVTIATVLGTVHFSNATYSVGENDGSALITVVLDAPVGAPVTVDYATGDGTAQAGSDYTAVANTLTFAPGVTSQTFAVPILPDTLDEDDETALLTLSNPGNATLGSPNPATLTIVDDDPLPAVQFTAGAYSAGEGSGLALVDVVLSPASGRTVRMAYATGDGTAQAGSDYLATADTLTFPPGSTAQSFLVALIDDGSPEADETVNLSLSNPQNATLAAPAAAVLTIVDDDAASGQVTIAKGVSPATVRTPGRPVTYTYTISIYNAGPSRVHVEQIADTLPAGFSYRTTLGTAGIRYPDTLVVAGQTVTWGYNTPLPALDAGAYATLTFQATASNGSGVYCNSVAVTLRGGLGTVVRDNLACVHVIPPVYRIESRSGNTTIVAVVRMEPTGPVIVSWEFLP